MKSKYEYVKAWRARPENKAKRAAEARRWRALHPDTSRAIKARHRAKHLDEIRERDAESQRRRRRDNPVAQRARMERFKAKQEALLTELAGRPRSSSCELCSEQGKTVFDHCHSSGKFRGWLCDRCNRTLGQVHDNAELLEKMINYLKKEGIGHGKIDVSTEEVAPGKVICISRAA